MVPEISIAAIISSEPRLRVLSMVGVSGWGATIIRLPHPTDTGLI
jgi:hypothetical protein